MSRDLTQAEKATNYETLVHICQVRKLLDVARDELHRRGMIHDNTKLEDPELATFVEFTPKLKGSTYGSEEYKGFLAAMKPALDHHYANHRHHPEHWPNGIKDMSLIDLIEMLADWKAATMRHADGCLRRSLFLNRTRFKIPDEIYAQLVKTADELGWLEPEWEHRVTEGPRKGWFGEPALSVEGWEEYAAPGHDHWERHEFTETRTWRRRIMTPEGERIAYPGAAS